MTRRRLLTSLLHLGPDELLGRLVEDLVDCVQDRVDVVGELLPALPALFGTRLRRFLGVLAAAPGVPLTARVLRRHRDPPCSASTANPKAILAALHQH